MGHSCAPIHAAGPCVPILFAAVLLCSFSPPALRWQGLLRRLPTLPRLTVHWCDSKQLRASWDAIAMFIGDGYIRRQDCTHHTHGSAPINDSVLALMDAQYVWSMGYSYDQLELLRNVRRPHDCSSPIAREGGVF